MDQRPTLFRVSTPPMLREFRQAAEKENPDAFLTGGKSSTPLGYFHSPEEAERSALKLHPPNSSKEVPYNFNKSLAEIAWENNLDKQDKKYYYFKTGFTVHDFVDAALHPPEYKKQFTVTGQTRRVTLKRQGPELGKKVTLNGKTIAIFRYEHRFYALENRCSHQGGPLFQGDIEDLGTPEKGLCVSCPYHGWNFRLDDGACTHSQDYKQQVYPCIVSDMEVMVGFENFHPIQFQELQF